VQISMAAEHSISEGNGREDANTYHNEETTDPVQHGYIPLPESPEEETNEIENTQYQLFEDDSNFTDKKKRKDESKQRNQELKQNALEEFNKKYVIEVERAIKERGPLRETKPMSSDDIDTIKSTMQSISLNYTPQWAQEVPEQLWLKLLLDKLSEKNSSPQEQTDDIDLKKDK
jgi:hypothetical protein